MSSHFRARITILYLPFVLAPWWHGCARPSTPPKPAPTRDGRWRQDLHYMAGNLARLHKNAFHKTSRAEFNAAVDDLDRRINRLPDGEIVVNLQRIAALVGDAHTSVGIFEWPGMHGCAIGFARFTDGIFVHAAADDASEAVLGGRLVRIGDTPFDAATKKLAAVISHENQAYLDELLPRFLRCAEILHAVGLSTSVDAASFAILCPDGVERTVTPEQFPFNEQLAWQPVQKAPHAGKPLYFRRRSQDYWYEYLSDSNTLYFAYNACRNMKGKSFADVAAQALRIIDKQPVEKFVLDLRNNGGGNSIIAWPLLWGLRDRPKINQRGRLFCLIGHGTFSSAELNAVEMSRWTNTLFVGEPTGQKPNSYGEVKSFKLPNCGLTVRYSTKYFRIYTDKDPSSFMPDIEAGVSFDDYLHGRDPAMEAILNYRRATIDHAAQ